MAVRNSYTYLQRIFGLDHPKFILATLTASSFGLWQAAPAAGASVIFGFYYAAMWHAGHRKRTGALVTSTKEFLKYASAGSAGVLIVLMGASAMHAGPTGEAEASFGQAKAECTAPVSVERPVGNGQRQSNANCDAHQPK